MKQEERKKPELGRVKEMQKNLYAKNVEIKDYKRHGFRGGSASQSGVSTSWDEPKVATEKKEVDLIEKKPKKRKEMTVFSKILIASMLFFMFSVAGAFVVFTLGKNEVSYDAVDISVLGPNSIAGGDQLAFNIDIINQNPVDIVLTDVAVSYPRGTVTADGQALPLNRDITSIDRVKTGFSTTTKFQSILFGKEGDIQNIKITYQYRVPGSNRIFFKERQYSIKIESSPVVLRAEHEDNYQNGDTLRSEIVVESNAAKPVQNLLLQIDYPFGFEFASSSPVSLDGRTFFVGDLDPGEIQKFTIEGAVVGQEGEQRTFRYTLGTAKDKNQDEIGTVFATNESGFSLRKPPMELVALVDGKGGAIHSARSGDEINFVLNYKNTLLSKLLDANIVASLSGSGYDRRSIKARDGYYRSSTQKISWDGSNTNDLKELEPAHSGAAKFRLHLLDRSNLAGVQVNPELTVVFESRATNFQDGGQERQVTNTVNKKIKVATDVGLSAKLLFEEGPFENTGPRSPIVGQNTTYTLHLQAVNTTSDVKDAKVQMKLPPYVSMRELQQPATEQVTYDDRNRIITWDVGEISAGAGYTSPVKELYLSLEYEPSLDHVGSRPDVLTEISLKAFDTWSEMLVSSPEKKVDTFLPSDTGTGLGGGTVRE